jgi:hypothetical protein
MATYNTQKQMTVQHNVSAIKTNRSNRSSNRSSNRNHNRNLQQPSRPPQPPKQNPHLPESLILRHPIVRQQCL